MEGSLEMTHLNLLLLWLGKLSPREREGPRAPRSPGLVVVPRFRIQVSKLPVQAFVTLAFHFLILFRFSPAFFFFFLFPCVLGTITRSSKENSDCTDITLPAIDRGIIVKGKGIWGFIFIDFHLFMFTHVHTSCSCSLEKTENWLEKERATKKKVCRII